MDARITVGALKAVIRGRKPGKGCIHYSDCGSQFASEVYRDLLATNSKRLHLALGDLSNIPVRQSKPPLDAVHPQRLSPLWANFLLF